MTKPVDAERLVELLGRPSPAASSTDTFATKL
jgi:hypothetical protein